MSARAAGGLLTPGSSLTPVQGSSEPPSLLRFGIFCQTAKFEWLQSLARRIVHSLTRQSLSLAVLDELAIMFPG